MIIFEQTSVCVRIQMKRDGKEAVCCGVLRLYLILQLINNWLNSCRYEVLDLKRRFLIINSVIMNFVCQMLASTVMNTR